MLGLGITLLIISVPLYLFTFDPPTVAADPWTFAPDRSAPSTTNSTPFLKGPFETGNDVTRACLTCHEDAGEQVIHTSHFTWLSEPEAIPGRDELVQVGKANLLNNFCIGVQSNWTGCTRCHTGYGSTMLITTSRIPRMSIVWHVMIRRALM